MPEIADNINLEQLVKHVDYNKFNTGYVPSEFALKFISFIKLVNGETGEENKSPLFHYEILDTIYKYSNVLIVCFRGGAKALDINTDIMTPNGVIKMKDIQVGDYVLDRNGNPARVTHVSDIFTNQCYRITLANGDSFIANEDHLHIVQYRTVRNNSEGKHENYWKEVVLNTKELIKRNKQKKLYIPRYVPIVDNHIAIESIEPVDNIKSKCIAVDSPTHSYLINDNIITHNTTLCSEYMILYLATFGKLEGFGDVQVMMYVGDTMENGCKNLRANVEHRYRNSEFLQKFIPDTRFTDVEMEFINAEGHQFCVRLFGASTGVRGFKKYGIRPQLACHKKGTIITTEYGIHKVEDYKGIVLPSRFNYGLEVKLREFSNTEIVTTDHRYLCTQDPRSNLVEWVEAKDLKTTGYIVSPNSFHQIEYVKPLDTIEEFIPINTPSHTYLTSFGISHNCLDDLMSDKSAESKTITKDIENVIYKAVRQAMHPTKRKVIWIGTPFNKSDPLYKAAGTAAWTTRAYPICKKFPCDRNEFIGAWEDRFSYDTIKTEYNMLKSNGKIDAFNQELMLRILSDDDRLVLDEDIVWYKRSDVLNNLSEYNVYITTDFATSEKENADFSVISVWAVSHKGKFHWIDGIVKRQDMSKNVDDIFRFVEMYKPLATGVEISGQQKGFVSWLKREMNIRGIYFYLASDKSSGEEGLRPNTSKLTRFNTALPLFKQRRIAFPEDLRESAAILEFIDEITSVTPSGFKSEHDDCADTISQLPLIEYFIPLDPKLRPIEKKEVDFNLDNRYYLQPESVDDNSSYIV